MTVKSTTVNVPCTLVEELVERTRFSWLQVAVAVGLVLVLFLIGTALLAGVLAAPFDGSLWRAGLLYPAIIVYILLMLLVLKRLRDGAIQAFRPLARMGDDEFEQVLAKAPIFNRRLEWLALGSGVVGGLLLWRPWDYSGLSTIWLSSGARSEWLVLYMLIAGGLWGGLLGWNIYSSLSGMRLFTGLQHHPLDINVFDLRPLQPIGRWSLGIALSYIGGSALSLLFVPQMTLNVEAVVLYGMLILTPVLVFFLNMLSTRQTIVAATRRHLDMVRDNLAAASLALEERAAKDQPEHGSSVGLCRSLGCLRKADRGGTRVALHRRYPAQSGVVHAPAPRGLASSRDSARFPRGVGALIIMSEHCLRNLRSMRIMGASTLRGAES